MPYFEPRHSSSAARQVILEPFSGDQVVAVTATLEHDFVCDKATETLGTNEADEIMN